MKWMIMLNKNDDPFACFTFSNSNTDKQQSISKRREDRQYPEWHIKVKNNPQIHVPIDHLARSAVPLPMTG